MNIYRVPLSVENTDVEYGYVFCDDNWVDTTAPSYIEDGYDFTSAGEILDKFDSWFGSILWRRVPNGRYNRVNTTAMLEYWSALIEQYWGSRTTFQALGTVYDEATDFATSSIVDGMTFSGSSNYYSSAGVTGTCTIAGNTPVTVTMTFSNDGFQVTLPVLPTSAVNNGKFNFTAETPLARVGMRIYLTGSELRKWEISTWRTSTGVIPSDWVTLLNGKEVEEPDDDPWGGEEDPSGTGGGGGSGNDDNWDNSDPNPVPPHPSLSAVDTGLITLYNPTVGQLQNLASYMWGSSFDLTQFKKIFADPMDAILGLNIVPVAVPSGGQVSVKVGNISTGVAMTKASSQYVTVDCGTLAISENWHGYLDYAPYTKVSIFLPYIGDHELDIDMIQGTTLGVTYHVDILSGACVAFITANARVVAQFAGQCAVSIPITGANFTQTILSLGTLVAAGAGVVATGGLSAPVTAASVAGAATAAANTAGTVASAKPRIAKSGNVSGGNGIMGTQKPYLIYQRPKPCVPAAQNAYTGYPAYITYTLSSLSGFTQVQDIHLEGISCTDTERDEILRLLREGVIL